MIRTKEELLDRLRAAGELFTSIVIFWIGTLVAGWLGGDNLVANGAIDFLGFLIAVALPSLLYGRPVFEVNWTVDSMRIGAGSGMVDFRAKPEVSFAVEVYAATNSIWSIFVLVWAKRKRLNVHVAIDAGVVDIKYQNSSPGVTWVADSALISIPVVSSEPGKQQGRFVGSLRPRAVIAGDDRTTVSLQLISSSGERRRYARVDTKMADLIIRS